MTNVLVTGMSGLIGTALRQAMTNKDYTLTALNRRPLEGVITHKADISDMEAILPAFKDKDAVVHLAGAVGDDSTWPDLLNTNVVGTYNVFEAARQSSVPLVVFASTSATNGLYRLEEPYKALTEGRYQDVTPPWPMITETWPVRPVNLYACTKVWGETVARYYADAHGITTVCLRIGVVNEQDRPTAPRDYGIWCSKRDIVQAIQKSLDNPPARKFTVLHVHSAGKWTYRSLDAAREDIGYEPADNADSFKTHLPG